MFVIIVACESCLATPGPPAKKDRSRRLRFFALMQESDRILIFEGEKHSAYCCQHNGDLIEVAWIAAGKVSEPM
jgi:hypothetical protein